MREWCNSHYVITVLKLSQVWPFPRPNPISGFFFFFFFVGGGGGPRVGWFDKNTPPVIICQLLFKFK